MPNRNAFDSENGGVLRDDMIGLQSRKSLVEDTEYKSAKAVEEDVIARPVIIPSTDAFDIDKYAESTVPSGHENSHPDKVRDVR